MTDSAKKIAIVDWTHLIEDYLDNIGVSFGEFRTEMTGGWLFGYIAALKSAGWTPVFFCFSADERNFGTHYHFPTGSEICVLPSPKIYRRLRRRVLNPYAESVDEACEKLNRATRPFYALLLGAAEYLSTPLISLARELRRQKITRILSQEYESGRFDGLALLAKITGAELFATFQGGLAGGNALKKSIRRLSVRLASGIICGSTAEIERVRSDYRLAASRTARIFNPLTVEKTGDLDRMSARKKYGISAGAKVAVWHGRIDLYRKGLDLLIGMWEKIRARVPHLDCELRLLGYGNQAAEFRELIDRARLTGLHWTAEFTNDRRRINEFLLLGDVYVFPSRHEGFPVAPLEAMNVGLPVLAADVSGMADILENGTASGGIIVPAEDPERLADELLHLFNDPQLCRTLGTNSRQRVVEAFSVENVGRRLDEFLNRHDQ